MNVSEDRAPLWRGRILLLTPVTMFTAFVVMLYWGLWNNDDRLASTLIGQSVPEFALPPIDGRQD